MLLMQHIILATGWLVFSLVHSLLAATSIKEKIARHLPVLFRHYRLVYNFIATFSLASLLAYQFALESLPLWELPGWQKWVAALVLAFGLIVMIISIGRYWRLLSGLYPREDLQVSKGLQQKGIHGIVRHPLYFGTLLFVLGIFLFFPYVKNAIAVVFITIYTIVGIRWEESKLLREFGAIYTRYKEEVPMIIPFLKKRKRVA